MRILPTLLFLPVLVLLGACTQTVPSAIATDDRPALPQPAIASPAPTPLTIESLAGTYKADIDEQELNNELREWKEVGLNAVAVKNIGIGIRRVFSKEKIIIRADGTFEASFLIDEYSGKVKIDRNKLIFTADRAQLDRVNKIAENPLPKCSSRCVFTLNISNGGKNLTINKTPRDSKYFRGYVKR
jgi:hypothetical protein